MKSITMQTYKRISQQTFNNIIAYILLSLLSCGLSNAQEQKLSMGNNSLTIEQIFSKIEQQSSYVFAYSKSDFQKFGKVQLASPNGTVKQLLSQALKNTGFSYKIQGNHIVITAQKIKEKPTKPKPVAPVVVAQAVAKIEEPVTVSTTEQVQQQPTVAPQAISQAIEVPIHTSVEPQLPIERKHPVFAQKTNLLYWATTTANIGAEVYLGKKWTAEASIGYNPWQFSGKTSLRHWLVQPELRYWTCQSFEGHFFGLHGLYGKFNVGEISFINSLKNYTYKGSMYGAGISYGYHFPLKNKWAIEVTAGFGYIHLDYDKYTCNDCLELEGSYKRNYWGPTKAGVSLIYLLE